MSVFFLKPKEIDTNETFEIKWKLKWYILESDFVISINNFSFSLKQRNCAFLNEFDFWKFEKKNYYKR